MISKTCKEVKKTIPNRGAPKEDMMFVNAEEEFFHEVRLQQVNSSGHTSLMTIMATYINKTIIIFSIFEKINK